MKIALHIGPRKTGTTSVQTYLSKRFGSEDPVGTAWYPLPKERGPGHALLAMSMSGYVAGASKNCLGEIIEAAESSAVRRLILSSEVFEGTYPCYLDELRDAVRGREVALITTQNALARRTTSLWQESVKQRQTAPLGDAIDWAMSTPGYQPNFVRELAEAIRPQRIALVYSSPPDPSYLLIERVARAMGLETDRAQTQAIAKKNERIGLIETEVMRHMNEVIGACAPGLDRISHRQLRTVLSRAFLSDQWRKHCPAVGIRLPETARRDIAKRAAEIAAALAAPSDDWPVVVYGDPDVVTFDSEMNG